MSIIMIKMQKHSMEELGECIENGLHCFGRAMSIYEDMKNRCEIGERRGNADYRYPDSMEHRDYSEDHDDEDRNERNGRRYSRY